MEENTIKETKYLIKKNKNILKSKNNKKIFDKKRNIIRKTKMANKGINIKKSFNKRKYLCFFILLIILPFISFLIYKFLFKKKERESESESEDYKIDFNRTIEKDPNEERKEIQNYMDLVLSRTLIDKDKIYYPTKNPKISIVISVYNGEGFLNKTILSIQNQDFKDVEIVCVDDGSKDNSVNLIKEFMKLEPRIALYENGENRGALYTKTKGVLFAKGKYVMILDEDDIYVQRDAFTSLYVEAEKNKLDILGFYARHSGPRLSGGTDAFSEDKKKIITQPELSNLMYHIEPNGRVGQFAGVLANIFVKTSVFKKAIKLIDEKNLNAKMNCHEDFILFFLLTRTASSAKYVDRLFYIWLHAWSNADSKISFRNEIKQQYMKANKCFAYINFLEILYKNTKDTFEDKKIAFSQLERWYLNIYCKDDKESREKAIEVFKLYLDCKYLTDEDKNKIRNYIENKNRI